MCEYTFIPTHQRLQAGDLVAVRKNGDRIDVARIWEVEDGGELQRVVWSQVPEHCHPSRVDLYIPGKGAGTAEFHLWAHWRPHEQDPRFFETVWLDEKNEFLVVSLQMKFLAEKAPACFGDR
jgi:hypothetical protein